MKLYEIMATTGLDDISDPMLGRDYQDRNESPIDKRYVDSERKPATPRRNSNIKRAQRISNRVKMYKRQSNPVADETHHQSNIGGHGSAFLFR
jgi:hypothetical protein